jgi:glycerol-3-phosphate acyltransferase PlsX
VKSGEADGCVSAGNTGALMSAGLFIVGRIKGVASINTSNFLSINIP